MGRQNAFTLRRIEVRENPTDLNAEFLIMHFLYDGQISLSRPYCLPLCRLRGPDRINFRNLIGSIPRPVRGR